MLKRFFLWIKRNKGCKSCCLVCPYYKNCKYDFGGDTNGRKI